MVTGLFTWDAIGPLEVWLVRLGWFMPLDTGLVYKMVWSHEEYVPIWVKLSGLELKFWGQTALKKISGLIGEYIRCDDATQQKTLLNFARVLVKVKPDQTYPNSIEFLDKKRKVQRIKVEYDWLPTHCTSCKGMRHLAVNSTSAPVVPSPAAATQALALVPSPVPHPPNSQPVVLTESTPSVPFTPARILTRRNSQNYNKDIGPSKTSFMDTFSAAVQRSVHMAKGGINSKKVLVARIIEEGSTSRVETRVKSNNWLKVRNNLCSSWALCTNNSLQKNSRVWLLWDPNCFDVNVVDITSQTIHSFVLSKVTGRKFWFTVVYGFNHSTGREILWNKLKEYDGLCHEAWADCVNWCQLQDIPAIGSFFTWNNKQGVDSRVYSRIDRMLVNAEWISSYPEAFANFLPEGLYDHCPCIVQFDSLVRRTRAPFKYYNMWSLSSDFDGIVREAWNKYIDGTKMFQVVSKLKMLKRRLRLLNKRDFNDIENNCSITCMALTEVQKKLRVKPMDPELIAVEMEIAKEYAQMQKAKHMFLLQKSKTEWATEGDDNIAYFHASIRSRRSRNKVIQVDDMFGKNQTEGQGINDAFIDYFTHILGTSKDVLDVHVPTVRRGKLVTDDMHSVLLKPGTAEEVKLALFSIPGTKAPGHDGYSSQFFKDSWDVIGV
ncbi:uncharacterized protein LOC141637247 [Silene latifolia]|uniref:uncharacterized protein LOC141637247 n=1 Tax=Silene latifolia TaxID=37657 RepID=UPI003D781CDA